MPKISKTEEAALQAGTVGFDGELFNGNPSLANLVKKYDVALRPEESAFMTDQVEKLCALLDDYEVQEIAICRKMYGTISSGRRSD